VTSGIVGGGSEPFPRIERMVGENIYTCGFQECAIVGRAVNGLQVHGMGLRALNVSQILLLFPSHQLDSKRISARIFPALPSCIAQVRRP
jgi:hypothetical protein